MEYILCRNCEQGNPAYLRLCSNCSTDLFAESEHDSVLPPVEEENAENLRKWALRAIVISIFTTAFKIWFVYSVRANAHQEFPNFTDILLIISPIITAAAASAKAKTWYRILLADSILMAIIFVVGLFFILYGMLS